MAGLMVRCADRDTEALLITTRPLPPHAHPNVSVSIKGQNPPADFKATVVPPFTAVLLPNEAFDLLKDGAKEAGEMNASISPEEGPPIQGAFPLKGFRPAYESLAAMCVAR